jgi:hypothetical protein
MYNIDEDFVVHALSIKTALKQYCQLLDIP